MGVLKISQVLFFLHSKYNCTFFPISNIALNSYFTYQYLSIFIIGGETSTSSPTEAPTGPEVCFDVTTNTTSWGNEIEWAIGCSDGSCRPCTSVPPNGAPYGNYETYTQECCLPQDQETFVVTCTDSYGDGWHGGFLEISGNQYCSQFSTGTEWIESMPNDQFVPEPGKYIYNESVVVEN